MGFFRREHDYRRHRPDDTAALFGGGAPPVADDPPLTATDTQERYHAALRRPWFRRQQYLALDPALDPVAGDAPPLVQDVTQELLHARRRPRPSQQPAPFDPGLFETPVVADSPPLQNLIQEAYHAANRRKARGLVVPVPLDPAFYELLDETFSVDDYAPPAWLFKRKPFFRPQQPFFDPALFPPPAAADDPLPAQQDPQALMPLFRKRWLPPQLKVDVGLLFPFLGDEPIPLPPDAQALFHAGYRRPPPRRYYGDLDPALFPVVTPDDPPLIQSLVQELFWAARRPAWRFRYNWRPLDLVPALFPEGGAGVECCDEILAAIAATQAALEARITTMESTLTSHTSLLNALQVDVTTLLGSMSGTISVQVGDSAKILEALRVLTTKVNIMRTAIEKGGTKL